MNASSNIVSSCIKGQAEIAIRLIARPAEFFRDMPRTGGMLDPLLFIVMTAMLDVLLASAESFVSHGAGLHDVTMMFGGLIVAPLIAVILSFFVAGLFYSIWSFMGSNENYETSYRCMAYVQILLPITVLLSIVPYLGLLGIAWWLYLMLIASREVHKTAAKPALLVFGAIAVLSSLVYYSSVSSALKSKEHLQELTRELQKMPERSGTGSQ